MGLFRVQEIQRILKLAAECGGNQGRWPIDALVVTQGIDTVEFDPAVKLGEGHGVVQFAYRFAQMAGEDEPEPLLAFLG